MKVCPLCKGSGKVLEPIIPEQFATYVTDEPAPPQVVKTRKVTCPKCKGTGRR